jgi:acyl carrier protein
MSTYDEVFEKVRSTLVDALGVDEDEVTPDASLFKDLGAESIDLLDIVFRLERNFGIKIPRGELFPENVSDPELARNGKPTPTGLTEMKQRTPYAETPAASRRTPRSTGCSSFTRSTCSCSTSRASCRPLRPEGAPADGPAAVREQSQ